MIPDPREVPNQSEAVTGRDVELIVVGALWVATSGWTGLAAGLREPVALALFLGLVVVSVGLAEWDVRSRDAAVASRIGRYLSR